MKVDEMILCKVEVQTKVAAAYNAASDSYDGPPLSFWERFGRRTVERLSLQPGQRVLDVCAGSGASALAVAERVAPGERVLAFDAVICVFGIFFVSDMSHAIGELWRMVRPGGQLALTTWGPNLFEPANTIFWDVIRVERPKSKKWKPM